MFFYRPINIRMISLARHIIPRYNIPETQLEIMNFCMEVQTWEFGISGLSFFKYVVYFDLYFTSLAINILHLSSLVPLGEHEQWVLF